MYYYGFENEKYLTFWKWCLLSH